MTDPDSLPSRSRAIYERLRELGVDTTVRELPESTHTARDAAAALGCPVGAIASSLVFIADDAPTLVLTSGKHRVDRDILARALGVSHVELAAAKEVKRVTGQPIGGVAPVGHPTTLPAIVDEALREHEVIWAAAGTPRTVMRLTFEQLIEITEATVATIAAD